MKFTIEPMGVGDILSRAVSLLWSRLGTLLAIQAAVYVPVLILELALPDLMISPGGAMVAVLPMLILAPIGAAATLHVIAQEYLGQPVSLGGAFKFAFGRFLPLLGTSILAGLGIGLGAMLCCVPGIYLWVIWAFVGQVVVMENLSGSSALGRSKELVTGYFWQVFAVMFLVTLCVVMVSMPINVALAGFLPFQDVAPGNANNPMPQIRLSSYLNFAITQVVTTALSVVGQTFTAICTTLLYFDMRNRKEAFDVEHIVAWMDKYRDWREEKVTEDAPAPRGNTAPETGIKQPGDAVPTAPPPETGIQDTSAPRQDPPPPPH